MMKKLFTIIICICAVTAQAQKPNNEALRKLQMAEFAITNLYVDKVDEDKLVEEAIIKMLAQLDPHSTYNNAEEVKKMNEPLQGNFEGIGVQFQMIEDTLLVIQPVSNGPSEKVGILAGDRIVAVNDSAIAGVKNEHGRYYEPPARTERLGSETHHRAPWRGRPAVLHREA